MLWKLTEAATADANTEEDDIRGKHPERSVAQLPALMHELRAEP